MSIQKPSFAAVVLAISVFPWAARAETPPASASGFCGLTSVQVTAVRSLYSSEHVGRGADVQRFAGAQVFLPAQPGLTPEWIRANLARRATDEKAQSAADCPLDVEGASAAVVSGGTGFWVQISATEPLAAREIFDRARRWAR